MSAPVLEMDNVSISLPRRGGAVRVLHGLSLRIAAGEMLALVGPSGGGKTMAAMSVPRLLPHGAALDGIIRLHGAPIQALPEPAMRRLRGARIGVVFQDNLAALNPSMRVGAQIAEVLRLHGGLGARAAWAEAIRRLDEVGIDAAAARAAQYPQALSGGMRQRAGLAMALAGDPSLLIADEPFAALDPALAARMLDLVGQLRRARGLAVLLISHDLPSLAGQADQLHVLAAGRCVEHGKADAVLTRPVHGVTAALLAACRSDPLPLSVPSPATPAPRIESPATPAPHTGPVLLEVAGLSVRFGPRIAVWDVHFVLRRGEALAVMGPSGAGKTSLGRAVLQMLPYQGTIRLEGAELAGLRGAALRAARRRIQPVFQDPAASLNPALRVAATLGEALRLGGVCDPAAIRARCATILDMVGLDGSFLDRLPSTLSGGQAQRVALARALLAAPDLLVLDEPTASLDATARAGLVAVLRQLLAGGRVAMLVITHDPVLAAGLARRVLQMERMEALLF